MADKEKKMKNRIVSLRLKAIAVVLVAAVVLSVIAVTISYNVYSSTIDEHFKTLASNLAKTAVTQLDTDDLLRYYDEIKKAGSYDDEKYGNDEKYKAEYDKKAEAVKDEEYYKTLDTLFDIKDSNDIKYLSVQKINKDGKTVTYIFDADHTDEQYQLGTTHKMSEAALEAEHPEKGIKPFITNTEEDGWICTVSVPVKDKDGKPVALVAVDLSMDEIMQYRADYLRDVLIFMTVAVLIICVLILFMVHAALVKPINKLSDAAGSFVEKRSDVNKGESALSKLTIKTGDEVENLCNSIKQMEQDINQYITHLTEVTAEKERIGAELELATKIQADMLPNIFPAFPERDDFDIYATMTPAKEVGGDFYDFFLIDDNHLAIVMADVSGKGVPAALFMMMSKILIQNAVLGGKNPAEALEFVNNQICANNREEMFVTVWLGILDLESGLLTAANAGHEKPVIQHADGEFEMIMDKHGFVIGGMAGLKYKNYEIELEKNSKLFIYTDGVAEATSEADELFGMERTVETLNSVKDRSPKEILEKVKESVDAFVGNAAQFDDLTMLCVEYIGSEGRKNEITLEATRPNVGRAVDFVSAAAEELPFSLKEKNQIEIAVDEIVCNVASYAYDGSSGTFNLKVSTDQIGMIITVTDSGIPYNPLEKEDPDVTLSADERGIGGYGIFIVKKIMDDVSYEYKDGKNILTMKKRFSE